MKFKHGTRRRALEYEKDWVQRWKDDNTFVKSVENRPVDNSYVFYDGPPFITGVPHHGTLLSSIVKDAVPRYQTMKGKRVERRWGWDTHGLPAENFVEKQLGITDRRQIVTNPNDPAPLDKDGNELPTVTLEHYITKARESMVANAATWQGVIDRVGRWVDFEGAYKTMDKTFMESVWWAFKQLYEKGKIYEGEKVLMYDTRFATPVSKNEVTMDNDAYQTVTDPSVFVKFKLIDDILGTSIRAASLDDGEKERTFLQSVPQDEGGFENPATPNELEDPVAFTEFLKRKVDESNGKNLKEGHVPATLYWIEVDGTIVGAGKVRHRLNDKLRNEGGGHIGIGGILEKYRGQGIGTKALALLVDEARKLGETEVLLTVEEDNIGSRRMIEKSGGVLEKSIDDVNRPGKKELFYWIRNAVEKQPTTLLTWTTTPWTLPANTALAVNPEMEYAEVKVGDEKFILARELIEKVLVDEKRQPLEYEIVSWFLGADLVGKSYGPLFADHGEGAHKIWAADYVSADSGTGIVHLAPIYGEEDFELAKEKGIPRVHVLDDNGFYYPEVAEELFKLMPWVDSTKPLEVWENNKNIAKGLKKAGVVWKIDYVEHEYPFNPRSKQRIMYRAIPSWFFDIQGQKPLLLEQNQNVNWFPEYLKNGRFAKNIEQAPDWNMSRDRFWATAMPVWKGDKGTVKVVGSYEELKELSGVELEDYHRPWVDDITFDIDGEHFTRIDKVLDCWFESGSMPFAQFHYPFENKDKFEANYPGDFIVEYVGQVRAWFYYVHVVNTSLADIGAFGEDSKKPEKNAFKNVITTGTVAGNDGRKMSKSLGNFTDPNELMDKFSADSLRFLLLNSPLLNGEDFSLQDKDVGDVARKLSMVWNMYDFFTMYAEVDGWEYDGELKDPLETLTNLLDIWIVSRVHQLQQQLEVDMDNYNIPDALSGILPFLDDASNWYVRRSRRRFWKSEDDGDKKDAYCTLHYVLVRLSYILAPFTPFLAEELYHNLTGDDESIHLKDWLPTGAIDESVMDDMERTRELINAGLGLRMRQDEHQKSIKVRQPLPFAAYAGDKLDAYYERIIAEELNVKEVRHIADLSEQLADYDKTNSDIREESWVEISKEITPELKREGLSREIIRHIQSARKAAGLNVDDRILLKLTTADAELQTAIDEHRQTIESETLARSADASDFQSSVMIDGAELSIALRRA